MNGLPLFHIELKKRGVDIKEAFNQINRYNRESFWAGSGLFEYVQLFVISNGTYTKYYSNTTRYQHCTDVAHHTDVARRVSAIRRISTSNSYEFTSWWADANNRPLTNPQSPSKLFRISVLSLKRKYLAEVTENMIPIG